MTLAEALAELVRTLKAADYRFVAVTPATHARVVSRPAPGRASLRDIFGWNREFEPDGVDDGLVTILQAAGALFGPDSTPDENAAGLAALGALARQYHVLTTYAADLGVTLQNPGETLSDFPFA